MNSRRCIVVGAGAVTHLMKEAMNSSPWLDIVGIVDPRPEACSRASEDFSGAKCFPSLAAALKSSIPDVAIINTPARFHATDVRRALEAGCHVLVAKPLAPTLSAAAELVDMSKRTTATLCVGEQIRYNKHFQAVREFLASGTLGRLESALLLNSKPRPAVGSLGESEHVTLFEMTTHHLDVLESITGPWASVAVWCDEFNPSWSPYRGGGMVNAGLVVNGVHVLYQGGVCAQGPMYELRLEGDRGALRCRGDHMSYGKITYEFCPRGGSFRSVGLAGSPDDDDPWLPLFDEWHRYLDGGSEPPFSAQENLRLLTIVDAAERSAREGRRVIVDDCVAIHG